MNDMDLYVILYGVFITLLYMITSLLYDINIINWLILNWEQLYPLKDSSGTMNDRLTYVC